MFSSCRATCPSSLGQLRAAVLQALSVLRPDSRQAILCASPRRKPELGQELGQGTWTNFITCFPLTEPLVQVRPGNLDKELGQLRAAVLQALLILRPDSRQAIPCASPLSLEGVFQWILFYLRGFQHSSVQHLTSSCEDSKSKTLRRRVAAK